MESFKIRCAELVVEIHCRYASTKKHCEKYLIDNTTLADIVIAPCERDYAYIEGQLSGEGKEEVELVTVSYLLSEKVIFFNSAVMHAAAISFNGEGIAFAAPSGIGKTTHMENWKRAFGKSVIAVNGDKPIVSIKNDRVFISGSPFCGKEGYSNNITVPLKAICFIERAEENSVDRVKGGEVLDRLFRQLFIPKVGSDMMEAALRVVDVLVKNVEFYIIRCNADKAAAVTAYNTIYDNSCAEDMI